MTDPAATAPDAATPKTVRASECIMNEIVLPNDTNGLGNLMGGRLLHWMDVCAAISAQRHTGRVCVTAAVDSVDFQSPIRQGEIVTLVSQVNRAFRTSMEVEINVWAENPLSRARRKCNRAFYTFVAMGPDGKPVPVEPVITESDDERTRFENAAKRREVRLVLSGRIGWDEAERVTRDVITQLLESRTGSSISS